MADGADQTDQVGKTCMVLGKDDGVPALRLIERARARHDEPVASPRVTECSGKLPGPFSIKHPVERA
jgi:hypothetical protein